MNLTFNNYSFILLVTGLFAVLLALLLIRKSNSAAKVFGVNMLFTALWAVAYSLELSSSTLPDMLIWVNVEYIGITMLPVTWIAFVVCFTGKTKLINKANIAAILVIPILTLVFVCTNDNHHLYYKDLSIDHSGSFPMLDIKPAIWYWIFTIYFYLNLAAGLYILASTFIKQGAIYKKQKRIIFGAALIPWIANIIYILGFRPHDHLDPTPYAFITSDLIVCYGLLKFSLFDIIPIAREKIIETLRDGVLVLDDQDRIIDVNLKMRSFLQQDDIQSLVGVSFNKTLLNQTLLHEVIRKRKEDKIEISKDFNGEERTFEVDVNTIFEKDIFTGSIITFRDITDRTKAEQKLSEQAVELRELNRLKDRLFSIIAHDLRGPIMNLKLLVNMISTGMITDAEFKSFIPELSKKMAYTSDLLENLLYWSKTQLEGQKIDVSVFDLKKLIKSEIQYSGNKAIEKGITILDEIFPKQLVSADVHMIELVMRNLINNAIKFSNKGDTITITANKLNHATLMVCVKDTGTGMKPEIVEKLFMAETFTTLGTNNEKGTGLGLQLCKDFIEKNNGKIWAESNYGIGTSVCFTIPAKINEPIIEAAKVGNI